MTTRRQFIAAITAAGTLAAAPGRLGAQPARPKAPFRLLYSNDITHIVSCVSPYHAKGQPFRPEMLQASVDEVAGTGVDVHLLQPGLGVVPMWPSKVVSLREHYAWIRQRYGQGPDSFGRYVLDGGDVVRVFIERCRLRGQTAFISLRLNDAHHKELADPQPGAKPGSSIGMSVTRFYVEHPEYRIQPGSPRAADVVLNWAVPAVRAQKLAMIQELCETYDLDGLELDFLRYCSFFRLGETPREQRCAIMAGFVCEVRALLDRTARGGRRRWLCARVPCYLESLDLLGLDLPELVAAGLDMINASAHYFTTQQHRLAGIRRRVPAASLYFEMCHSTWNGPKLTGGYDAFPFRRTTAEQYRTAAHLAYARGADGVSLFNFPYYREHGGPGRGPFAEPPFEVLCGLTDPRWLAQQSQHWFLAPGWRAPGTTPAPLPRPIEPGKAAAFTLDLAPPAKGWTTEGRLRLQLQQPSVNRRWRASLNGNELVAASDVSEPYPNPYPSLLGKTDELRAWRVPSACLREGVNRVEVTLDGGEPATAVFLDLSVS